jgi:four helix bundle protein
MFDDFKTKEIYIKAKELYSLINRNLSDKIPYILHDQITRAAISIILNFPEGYGRFTKNDKKHFYITARGSLNEVVACFDLVQLHEQISEEDIKQFDILVEELSKMLSGLINSQK